jgi:hypothetical protein
MHERMRQMNLFSAIAVLSMMALAGTALAQGADPSLGTWKLNLAKSTYSGSAAPKSQTVKYETSSMGTTVTTDGVAADGSKTSQKYTTKYDGKDVPLSGSANADTVALTRIDALTIERIDKKAGKVVQTIRRTIAADGKTMTVVTKGTNAQGKPVNNTAVYEKQ